MRLFLDLLTARSFADDVIMDTMTVREALTMSALLRLPRREPHSSVHAAESRVHCRDVAS